MDYFDSKAAVDAMAALQAQIKDLEAKNEQLKFQIQNVKVDKSYNDEELHKKEVALLSAGKRAEEMFNGASESMIELRRLRKINRQIKARVDELQKELSIKLDNQDNFSKSLKKSQENLKNAKALLSEYEDLFCEILAPPDFEGDLNGAIPFNCTTASITTFSLPATLQTTMRMLQSLPFPFRDQKLDKKREIISILMNARDIAFKLSEEIHQLEIEKRETGNVRRLQGEIDSKTAQLAMITQGINRFRLE